MKKLAFSEKVMGIAEHLANERSVVMVAAPPPDLRVLSALATPKSLMQQKMLYLK